MTKGKDSTNFYRLGEYELGIGEFLIKVRYLIHLDRLFNIQRLVARCSESNSNLFVNIGVLEVSPPLPHHLPLLLLVEPDANVFFGNLESVYKT